MPRSNKLLNSLVLLEEKVAAILAKITMNSISLDPFMKIKTEISNTNSFYKIWTIIKKNMPAKYTKTYFIWGKSPSRG